MRSKAVSGLFRAVAAGFAAVACAVPSPAAVVPLADWEFSRDGTGWERVSVPHDWAIKGPFDKEIDKQVVMIREDGETKATEKTGRTGSLPWIGDGFYRRALDFGPGVRTAAVVFGAAMSEPQVFLDGKKIGEWKHGYTTFKVDLPPCAAGRHLLEVRMHTRGESSRWYPGAGLIRPVYLVTDEADPEAAVLGRPGKRARMPKVTFDDAGFRIDGRPVVFNGVCLHHDLGPLGAAWHPDAFRRQLRKLKDLGVNAIRTSHNQPSAEQLDICDEEGVWVVAESFDEWATAKCRNGYHLWFRDWWKRDLAQLVKVCRDHPCVVMYSIGNEVWDQGNAAGRKYAREMQDFIRSLDPTRPCTMGMNHPDAAVKAGVLQEMDVAGLNYNLAFYPQAEAAARHGRIYGSETASAVSSRGAYHLPLREWRPRTNPHPDGQCSGYDVESCAWGNLPDRDWERQEDDGRTFGEFVWTGFDYLGEPSPYNEHWPSRSSYFGMFDLAGLPKDRAYLYRSHWNKADHTLHVVPHWTWPGREGQVVPIEAYTDFDTAELFVNGVSKGRRTKRKGKGLGRFRLWWTDVPYEPGELKVVAFGKDGKAAMTAVVRTAGAFDRYEVRRETYGSLDFFTVSAVDKAGTLLPDADERLAFEVSGAGRFKAVCNGDATSLEMFHLPQMRLFHGQLVVIAERTGEGACALKVRKADERTAGHK